MGGALFGLLLSTATIPYLEFSSALEDPATAGVPPTLLVLDPARLALFFATLMVALVAALVVMTRLVQRHGVGGFLRVQDD